MCLLSSVLSAQTSTTSRSGAVGLIRFHLEPAGFSAPLSYSKSTGTLFQPVLPFPLWCSVSLFPWCRAFLELSTLTVPGSLGIQLLLGNTTPSSCHLGIAPLIPGTSVVCARAPPLPDLHMALWVLLAQLWFWLRTTLRCLVLGSWLLCEGGR